MLCERGRNRYEIKKCNYQIEICNRNIRDINIAIVNFKVNFKMASYFSKNDDEKDDLNIMDNMVEILDDYNKEIEENRECIRLCELRKEQIGNNI